VAARGLLELDPAVADLGLGLERRICTAGNVLYPQMSLQAKLNPQALRV
jgi:hypothetical protein